MGEKFDPAKDWCTPVAMMNELRKEFGDMFDPCPYPRVDWDGLTIPWKNPTYCNPPWCGSIGKWVFKAFTEARAGNLVVMLLPAGTDTSWFHDIVVPNAEVRFIRGRPYGRARACIYAIFRPEVEKP